MQAALKLVATWAGHTGPVLAVAFHPSGTVLASCDTESAVCLWTLEAVEPPRLLLGPTQTTMLFAVAFHPKLALVASLAGTGQLWWWNLPTGQVAGIWGGHDAEGLALTFSHDGRLLATGAADGVALIRESIGGTVLQRLPHPDTICSLAWSPDDQYLLTGAQDGQARVWQVASGQLRRSILQAEGWVNAVAWSPDGRQVACGLETEQAVLVDLPASQATRVLEGHIGSIFTVAFSPDGQVFATGSADGTMRLWDVSTGRFLLASGDHQQRSPVVLFPPALGLPASGGWPRPVGIVWCACGPSRCLRSPTRKDALMRLFGWFRRAAQRQATTAPTDWRWSWFAGRRMLSVGSYIFPKDVAEGNRLDLQHHLIKLGLGSNYRAPIRQPGTILDVACGTGIWCRELALEFPKAQVIGFDVDTTPIESARSQLGQSGSFPRNFQFLEANALQSFPFADNTFDFTHARLIAGFVPIARWPEVVAEMVRVTRPGGYLELVENELPSSASPAFTFLIGVSLKMLDKYGLYAGAGPHLAELFRQAGLERVQQRRIVLGTGRQASRQQRLMITDLVAGAENFQPMAVKAGLVKEADYRVALARDRDELTHYGVTWPYSCTYGMKPRG